MPSGYQTRAHFASPAKSFSKPYKVSSLTKLGKHFDKGKNYSADGSADYFAYEFDQGSNTPYMPKYDKLVGTKLGHFKSAKSSNKAISVKQDQPIYFDIYAQLVEPTSAYTTNKNHVSKLPIKEALTDKNDPNLGKPGLEKGTKSQQGFVLRDYIDSNLTVESADVYYSKKWGDKYLEHGKEDASKYFYKPYIATVGSGPNAGKTAVDAVLKPKAAKLGSGAWMKDYHLVIKAKLKENVVPTNGTYAHGSYLLDNQGYLDTEPTSHGWVRFGYTHEIRQGNGEPGLDSKKRVYAANLTNPNKIGKALDYGTTPINEKLLGDLVYPDQYLYYRLKFTIHPMAEYQEAATNGHAKVTKTLSGGRSDSYGYLHPASKGDALIKDRYKKLTITDKLSDRFLNEKDSNKRDVDDVQVVMDDKSKLNTPKQNHNFKLINGDQLKINITDNDILTTLSKSVKKHDIYVQYRVRIRPNDAKADQTLNLAPSGNQQYDGAHKVANLAQIDGTFEEQRRKVIHDTYTIENVDGKGHSAIQKVSGTKDWSDWNTKTLSSESKLMNKTITNKTINWISIKDNPLNKVPISWANTNDVINDTDKVWKVQTTMPTMRQEGRLLKLVTLKDTVKSNEKLDATQQWSADNSEDSDLATGTYTGPQVFRNGKNVTNYFDINSSSTTVIANAKESYLKDLAAKDPDTPNQFTLAVPGKIVESRKLNQSGTFDALTGAQDQAVVELEKQNDPNGDRKIAESDWEGEPDEDGGNDTETTIHKSVKNIKDLTTGQNVNGTGDGQKLNPQHQYEVTYQLDAQLGTDRDNRNLKISDALPENSTLVNGSLSVPSGFNTDGTTSTDVHIAYDGNANVLAAKGTMDNPTIETMTYKVKVNANSDWSDYYNADTRSGRGQISC